MQAPLQDALPLLSCKLTLSSCATVVSTANQKTPEKSLAGSPSGRFKNKGLRARCGMLILRKANTSDIFRACTVVKHRYSTENTGLRFRVFRQAREVSSSSERNAPPMTSPAELEVKRLQVYAAHPPVKNRSIAWFSV